MNDIEKLRAILPHWIEHNAEHANDFRLWVERMRASGHDHVAKHLEAAVEKMESANRDLEGALEHLGADHGATDHQHTHHHHA